MGLPTYANSSRPRSGDALESRSETMLMEGGQERDESGMCEAALGHQHQRCKHRHLHRLPLGKNLTLSHHPYSCKPAHSTGVLLSIVPALLVSFLLLSLNRVTLAGSTQPSTPYHRPLNWNFVQDRSIVANPYAHTSSYLNLPDKSATIGRLFFYQISLEHVTKYQVCQSPPSWLQ